MVGTDLPENTGNVDAKCSFQRMRPADKNNKKHNSPQWARRGLDSTSLYWTQWKVAVIHFFVWLLNKFYPIIYLYGISSPLLPPGCLKFCAPVLISCWALHLYSNITLSSQHEQCIFLHTYTHHIWEINIYNSIRINNHTSEWSFPW